MGKTRLLFVYLSLSILFFLASNVVLSPVSYFVDKTFLQPLRGPFIEEFLKYALFIFFIKKEIHFSPVRIAIAIGCAETINNVAVGYYLNFSDVSGMIKTEGIVIGISILSLSALIKLISSIFVHYITFKIGLFFFDKNVFLAILVSISTHIAINYFVLSIWN